MGSNDLRLRRLESESELLGRRPLRPPLRPLVPLPAVRSRSSRRKPSLSPLSAASGMGRLSASAPELHLSAVELAGREFPFGGLESAPFWLRDLESTALELTALGVAGLGSTGLKAPWLIPRKPYSWFRGSLPLPDVSEEVSL